MRGIIRDRAVWSPIYSIAGRLDRTLAEIFMPEYTQRLEAAQERLLFSMYREADQSAVSSDDAARAEETSSWTSAQLNARTGRK